MPGMPYHLEKGPWLSVLEDYLNADSYRLRDALEQFRRSREQQTSLADLEFLASPVLDKDPDYPTLADRKGHLQNDWFGSSDGKPPDFVRRTLAALDVDEVAAAELQGPGRYRSAASISEFADRVIAKAELDSWPTTGFWFQYHGDVEGIVRDTLIRSIEVAIGIDHNDPIPAEPERVLPIELFWKCPQRWFEGWVTWRWDDEHRTGQVTVLLATPGSGKPVLEDPKEGDDADVDPKSTKEDEAGDPPKGPGPDASEKNAKQSAKGMWVITHGEHAQLPAPPANRPKEFGDWALPPFGPTYVGTGPIVCVQPDERDGGVKPFGRKYDPSDLDGVDVS